MALTEVGAPHGMAGPAAACVCFIAASSSFSAMYWMLSSRVSTTTPSPAGFRVVEAYADTAAGHGLTIPPDFSRRVLARNDPRVALIEDNAFYNKAYYEQIDPSRPYSTPRESSFAWLRINTMGSCACSAHSATRRIRASPMLRH